MKSQIISVNSNKFSIDFVVKQAVSLLRSGEIIAFPTDTVYGLGTRLFDVQAIRKLFLLKNRPFSNPINVLISSVKQLDYLTDFIPSLARELMNKYWPGGLTIVLKKKTTVPDILTANKDTVGIRMPKYDLLLNIIERLGEPIVASSANLSGEESPYRSEKVISTFNGRIPLIIDGGPTSYKRSSTVVDLSGKKLRILREGSVSKEELANIGNVWL